MEERRTVVTVTTLATTKELKRFRRKMKLASLPLIARMKFSTWNPRGIHRYGMAKMSLAGIADAVIMNTMGTSTAAAPRMRRATMTE